MSQPEPPSSLEQRALADLVGAALSSQRTAYIVPTTARFLAMTKKFESNREIAIVSPRLGNVDATLKSLLSRIAERKVAPKAVFIFSDQLLDPADATLFVRYDGGEGFFSPVEAILNIKYLYGLEIWTGGSWSRIAAGTGTIETVLCRVIEHIRCCESLGELWKMRELQGMRTAAFRAYQARRKLRFFRSSAINAYADEPTHPEVARLLAHAEALEKVMNDTVQAV